MTTAMTALALVLAGCTGQETAGNGDTETPGTVVAPTVDGAPDPQDPDGNYIRQELREDPEQLMELDGQMREQFPAFQGQDDNIGPMFLGMQLCTGLDADDRSDREAQTRYEEYLEEFSHEDFDHVETGQNWVDFSIEQICPHLEPTTS
ncbi:hypothetical protein [Ornithinimicrobium pratense]|uniref:DUF732 domain-containing protein n=1 Tax=Ornithinimicrobium pratense TaxID=2593973 RepID=A0A5J6V4F6_9MICO|nr:hypothetical protein [Ornithinimicrobium pratense]QFG68628.1 hypothetical protein FY030_07770 [Ornithinimicrobium pratense]